METNLIYCQQDNISKTLGVSQLKPPPPPPPLLQSYLLIWLFLAYLLYRFLLWLQTSLPWRQLNFSAEIMALLNYITRIKKHKNQIVRLILVLTLSILLPRFYNIGDCIFLQLKFLFSIELNLYRADTACSN